MDVRMDTVLLVPALCTPHPDFLLPFYLQGGCHCLFTLSSVDEFNNYWVCISSHSPPSAQGLHQ